MAKQSVIVELSINADGTGRLDGAYLRLSGNKVHRTVEKVDGVLMVDYDSRGRVVGAEILAPVKLDDLLDAIRGERSLRPVIKKVFPAELIAA